MTRLQLVLEDIDLVDVQELHFADDPQTAEAGERGERREREDRQPEVGAPGRLQVEADVEEVPAQEEEVVRPLVRVVPAGDRAVVLRAGGRGWCVRRVVVVGVGRERRRASQDDGPEGVSGDAHGRQFARALSSHARLDLLPRVAGALEV